jgi:hypothetical protein
MTTSSPVKTIITEPIPPIRISVPTPQKLPVYEPIAVPIKKGVVK